MDADDTIFDFPRCEYEALKMALTDCGYEFSDEICAQFSRINSALWKKFELGTITRSELSVRRFKEMIEQCFEGTMEGREDFRTVADQYVKRLSGQAILLDGALENISRLSQEADIYIITNGLKTVQRGRFSSCPVTQYLKKLYISDEIGWNKPDKRFFDAVLLDLPEKDPSAILVVGDSLTSDMQGGRNSGLDTCLFDPNDRVSMPHPLVDIKIHSLSELNAIIRGE